MWRGQDNNTHKAFDVEDENSEHESLENTYTYMSYHGGGVAGVASEYEYPCYDSNIDWDPNNPYTGLGDYNNSDPFIDQTDPWEQEEERHQQKSNHNHPGNDVSSVSSNTNRDQELDEENPFTVFNPANDDQASSSSTYYSQDYNEEGQQIESEPQKPEWKPQLCPPPLPPLPPPSATRDTFQTYDYELATMVYPSYDSNNDWDPNKPYAYGELETKVYGDPWDNHNNQEQTQTIQTSTTTTSSLFATTNTNKSNSFNDQYNHNNKKNQSLFGTNNQPWRDNYDSCDNYPMESAYSRNDWNPDNPYGGSTTYSSYNYDSTTIAEEYDSNHWNPNQPDADLTKKAKCDEGSSADAAEKDLTPLPQLNDNACLVNKIPEKTIENDTRKKFDFDRMDKQVKLDDQQAKPLNTIPQEDNDINKWLGGNIVKNGEIVRVPETPKKPEPISADDHHKKMIRFASEVTDLETGENSGSLNPGSSLASDDSHPKEIRLHKMQPVPEDSVPASAGLNFNTIVLHNRLNPSKVPEPVLSSSLESSNFNGPFVRKKNNSSEDDSKRTHPSEDATSREGHKSKRRRFWALVFGGMVFVGAAAAVIAVVVSGANEDKNSSENPNGSTWEVDPYEDEDVVRSGFRNPASVQWTLHGQISVEYPDATRNSNHGEDQAVSISAEGTTLAIGSYDGTVRMYQWGNSTSVWRGEAVLEFPSVPNRSHAKSLVLALSGNGRRLTVGSPDVGRVYSYDYQEDNEVEPWRFHVQPILEIQTNDGTGSSVALTHDGSVVAVGSPYFDGNAVNSGQIRLFSHSGVAWQPEAWVEGEVLNDNVGGNVGLSPDGSTLVSGTSQQNTKSGFESGLVWAWNRPPVSSNYVKWEIKGEALLGPTDFDHLGYQISLSTTGRVLALSAPGYATGVVFVYEYSLQRDAWELRGSPIPAAGTSKPGVCLSADGNVVAVATRGNVEIFQYQKARNVANSATMSPREWVPVGAPFTGAAESSGNKVACSADGRVVVVGGRFSVELTSTVTVLKAVEH